MSVRTIHQGHVELQSEEEVLHSLRVSPAKFAALIGAGVSQEAGVPLASDICQFIREQLSESIPESYDVDKWANDVLSWNDPKRRYSTCLLRYGNPAQRVVYFRRLLKDCAPAFGHFALALLMEQEYLSRTALTTNFDKLFENAFVQEGMMECQPVRTQEEGGFWDQERDKCYLLKLHGDYDTHNILNTRDETRNIAPFFKDIAVTVFRRSGLLVLGSSGNEDSVQRFLEDISASSNALSFGVHWGVYVGADRPDNMGPDEEYDTIEKAILQGAVSREMVELLSLWRSNHIPCSFFPVWGTGNFLFRLIQKLRDRDLQTSAELYLDHETRLKNVFRKQGLSPQAIDRHLQSLRSQQKRVTERARQATAKTEPVWEAHSTSALIDVRVTYGDISSRSAMEESEFRNVRRAVVSPEDTAISAGGGVAYALLQKAGSSYLLNELVKHSPIEHCDVAVTSAGRLPVHYVLHAAALKIETDGSYIVNLDHVGRTVENVICTMGALHVQAVWIPLLAAGVGPLTPAQSLQAILERIGGWPGQKMLTTFIVVILNESVLSRDRVGKILKQSLGDRFKVDRSVARRS